MWKTSTSISMGLDHALALVDGEVFAWGNNVFGKCNIPASIKESRDVIMISAAKNGHHSMALKNDGTLECWGYNGSRQCNVPASIKESRNVVAISAGGGHSMALTETGRVECWGENHKGIVVPDEIQGKVIAISAGGFHSMALTKDYEVRCWGGNYENLRDVPEHIQGKVIAISAGLYVSCAILNDGKIICWNAASEESSDIPDDIKVGSSSPTRVSSISMERYIGAAVLTDSHLRCWTSSSVDSRFASSFTDIPCWIQGLVATVSIGLNNVLVSLTTGKVVCWGPDTNLRNVPSEILGIVDSSPSLLPRMTSTAAAGDKSVVALSPQMTSTAAAVDLSSEQSSNKCFNCSEPTQYGSFYCEKCKSGKFGGYSFLQYFHHCY